MEQPRYRAGYDFLRLRADAGEVDGTLADWWDDFAQGNEEERSALLADARDTAKRVPKTHQVPRKTGPKPVQAEESAEAGESSEGSGPAKKRRRRRKPKAPGAAAAPSAAE